MSLGPARIYGADLNYGELMRPRRAFTSLLAVFGGAYRVHIGLFIALALVICAIPMRARPATAQSAGVLSHAEPREFIDKRVIRDEIVARIHIVPPTIWKDVSIANVKTNQDCHIPCESFENCCRRDGLGYLQEGVARLDDSGRYADWFWIV